MIQDAQGHYLSGATAEAVTAYDRAVRAFNLVHGDAVGLFDMAREAAPEFAMPYLGKAWVYAVANDPGLRTQAGEDRKRSVAQHVVRLRPRDVRIFRERGDGPAQALLELEKP